MKHKWALVGALAILTALFVGGGISFAAGNSDSNPNKRNPVIETAAQELGISPKTLAGELFRGNTLADMAKNEGVSEVDLLKAITNEKKTRLMKDLDEGRITEEQYERLLSILQEKVAELLNSNWLMKPSIDKSRHGKNKPQGPHHLISASAKQIGIDPKGLIEQLQSGKTIAEVADHNGIAADSLLNTLVQPIQERIDEAMSTGKISTQEAGQRLQETKRKFTDLINQTWPSTFDKKMGKPGKEKPRGQHHLISASEIKDAASIY